MKQSVLPMRNRADFLKRLYESPGYRNALAQARTDDERRRIVAVVTGFVGGVADVLGPIIDSAQKDPSFAQRLGQALIDGQRVVTGSEPAASGSSG